MYHNVVYDTISSYDTIIANTMLEVWPAIIQLLLSSVVDGHRAGVEVENGGQMTFMATVLEEQ